MMAQLVPSSQGARERVLACGCCETRWKYKRIGCPFCRNEDSDLLEILTVEDEQKLRIDACRQCRGYLKTYIEVGQEELPWRIGPPCISMCSPKNAVLSAEESRSIKSEAGKWRHEGRY